MKHISAVLVVLLAFAQNAFSQSTKLDEWDKPSYSCSESSLELQKVTFYSDQTVLWFKYTNKYDSGGCVYMEKTAKITAYPSGNIYTLTRTAGGIPYAPAKHEFKRRGETLLFNLFFPAVPSGTTSLNFVENYSSGIKIYNIKKNSSSSSQSNQQRSGSTTVTVGRTISTSDHNWTLKQIELTSLATVMRWSVTPKSTNTYIQMTKGAYLQDNSGKKYYMKSCEGMSMEPEKDILYNIRTVDYSLVFPPIDASAKTLTYYSSPTFQIHDIGLNNRNFSNNSTLSVSGSYSAPVAQENTNRNRSTTYTAFAACFSYPDGRKWSDFSDWQECNFTIEFDASSKIFTFNTAKVQKYKVVESDYSDPSLFDYSYSCKDISNNLDCSIQVATLPEDGGMQLYLRFDDEQICYAIKEQKSRSDIASEIRSWGKCRLVAITETNGDVAINGSNEYTSIGLPDGLLQAIAQARRCEYTINDITLTEKGNWSIVYGGNGSKRHGSPDGFNNALSKAYEGMEIIRSAVFNDNGDWIVISDKYYRSSSFNDYIKEGQDKYGTVYSATLTNDALIIVYEKGYKYRGNIPESLGDAINNAKFNVFMIKIS